VFSRGCITSGKGKGPQTEAEVDASFLVPMLVVVLPGKGLGLLGFFYPSEDLVILLIHVAVWALHHRQQLIQLIQPISSAW
jgi:hypothetical protein